MRTVLGFIIFFLGMVAGAGGITLYFKDRALLPAGRIYDYAMKPNFRTAIAVAAILAFVFIIALAGGQ